MTAITTENVEPPIPRYVYKILSEEPPEPLPYTLPLTPLDKQDGFIHLSAEWRVGETASLYFGSYTTIWLLRVDTEVARGEKARFKWGEAGCVHMYGASHDEREWARMGEGVVDGVLRVARGKNEEWPRAVRRAMCLTLK
jgi:Protein of unknown function (DUF952)